MAFQRPPPSPLPDDDSPCTPPLLPSPASSEPSLSSASTSASSLATPFEQLALDDGLARPPSPQSPHSAKLHADSPHDAPAPTDVIRDGHNLSGAMFERMQDSDRTQSRRSTPASPTLRTHTLPHLSHTPLSSRSPAPPSPGRPPLPHRNTSLSKRNASFDSPREVPLPSLPSRLPNVSMATSRADPGNDHRAYLSQVDPTPAHSGPSVDSRADTSVSTPSEASIAAPCRTAIAQSPAATAAETAESDAALSSAITSPTAQHQLRVNQNATGPTTPYPRPFSSGEPPRLIHSPTPVRPDQFSDRGSTCSLPLPMNTPYHTLPTVQPDPDRIVEDEPTAVPPSTSSILSAASYPGDGSTGVGTTRANRLPSAGYGASSSYAMPSGSPDWLRENSNMRQAAFAPAAQRVRAPARPAVLTPPPPVSGNSTQEVHRQFLSQAPPPQDSYLAIQTSAQEYTLIASLPGFRRESMTLSTRRRRILHIVADSWEPNGGHFERRIAFGYDADLTQVRAEFDGDLLRIIVPRRISPVTYWSGRI